MKREDILGALARGYCSDENAGKEVDVVLCEAMADEIAAVEAAEADWIKDAVDALRKIDALACAMTGPAGLDLPTLERLCEAATPEPWHYWQYTDADGDPRLDGKAYQCHCFSTSPPVDEFSGIELREEDACFIVTARTALPKALATIRARDEEVRRLQGELEDLRVLKDLIQSERDGYCGQHMAAQARVAELEGAYGRAIDALIWCSGNAAFGDGGEAREGWLRVADPAITEWLDNYRRDPMTETPGDDQARALAAATAAGKDGGEDGKG